MSPIPTSVKPEFLNLFSHIIAGRELSKGNSLDVFLLKASNNRLNYLELVEELYDHVITYALSRLKLAEFKDSPGGKAYQLAISKVRQYSSNEGELGEILLYCFLEAHLGAPKILSKLELKTAGNDYVKGTDGVHLYCIDANNYQLVLGESKLDKKLSTAVSEAFESIKKYLESTTRQSLESGLINSNLIKESIDTVQYEQLKSILIPTRRTNDVCLDKSFGLLLGYEIECGQDEMNLPNSEFRSAIEKLACDSVERKINQLTAQLSRSEFSGYQFYVYAVPFTDLANKRKELIKGVTCGPDGLNL